MTALLQSVSFRREATALWRDTGVHVVVLPEHATEVKVLGGGGAWLWRMLDEPASMLDLLGVLTDEAGPTPDAGELEACLLDLVEQGLLRLGEQP